MSKIKLLDVKTALLDPRFRESLPPTLLPDVQKFLANPGCGCNLPVYRRVLKEAGDLLAKYYPQKEYEDPDAELEQVARNSWTVLNCRVDELESRLRSLPPGRKQIAVARYEDMVTVVVNELDFVYSP